MSTKNRSSTTKWYVFQDEREIGPISTESLLVLITNGQVTDQTPLRKSKHDKWVRAYQVEGLFARAEATGLAALKQQDEASTTDTEAPGPQPQEPAEPSKTETAKEAEKKAEADKAAQPATPPPTKDSKPTESEPPGDASLPTQSAPTTGATPAAALLPASPSPVITPNTHKHMPGLGDSRWTWPLLGLVLSLAVVLSIMVVQRDDGQPEESSPEAPGPTAQAPKDPQDHGMTSAQAGQKPVDHSTAPADPARTQPDVDRLSVATAQTTQAEPGPLAATNPSPSPTPPIQPPTVTAQDSQTTPEPEPATVSSSKEDTPATEAAPQTPSVEIPPAVVTNTPPPPPLTQPQPQPQERGDPPYQWEASSSKERELQNRLLGSEAWHFRVFGLLRLERYHGEVVNRRLKQALEDPAWQVRCVAMRQCLRHAVTIDAEDLKEEENPQVLRTALRYGIAVDEQHLDRQIRSCLRKPHTETQLLGMELALLHPVKKQRERGSRSLKQFISRLRDGHVLLFGDQLQRLCQIPAAAERFTTAEAWKHAYDAHTPDLDQAPKADLLEGLSQKPLPRMAQVSTEDAIELTDYLDSLAGSHLDLVIMLDATGSMGATIRSAQAQINRLVLILQQLNERLQLACIAYRDSTDRKPVERSDLTDDVDKVRSFLVQIEAEGGGDHPESVASGFAATDSFRWGKKSTRQFIVIGDAPDRPEQRKELEQRIIDLGRKGHLTHFVTVGHGFGPDPFKELALTASTYGGRSIRHNQTDDLARAIMKLSLEDQVGPFFDDFYDILVRLCL